MTTALKQRVDKIDKRLIAVEKYIDDMEASAKELGETLKANREKFERGVAEIKAAGWATAEPIEPKIEAPKNEGFFWRLFR